MWFSVWFLLDQQISEHHQNETGSRAAAAFLTVPIGGVDDRGLPQNESYRVPKSSDR